jgi:hypothetical protein
MTGLATLAQVGWLDAYGEKIPVADYAKYGTPPSVPDDSVGVR